MLYTLRFKYTGTADFNDLSNVQVNINGTDYPVTWMTGNGTYAMAAFVGGVSLKQGSSLDVSIHGDIAPAITSGQTVEFDIEEPADMYFVGQTYGYGVAPSAGSWQKGSTFVVAN